MKKLYLFCLINLCLLLPNLFYGQAPAIQWQKCYGDTSIEYFSCIEPTIDGGFIAVGRAYSNSGDVSGNHDTTGAHSDVWIVKIDSTGIIQWKKCYGGTDDDIAGSISQTYDSGYIVGATTRSTDGDVIGNHGLSDIWILKLDSSGNIQWKKCYGGSQDDQCNYIQEINNDGFIIAAQSFSNDGNLPGHHGTLSTTDAWALKLNGVGNIDWSRNFGGTDWDYARSASLAYDGGFIIGCRTLSNDGDVIGNHGMSDSWLIKLDYFGNLEWQKCFGGTNNEMGFLSPQKTIDFGYIFASMTYSNNGDVTGNHGTSSDYWIVKTDSLGNLLWQKCYGGTSFESVWSINNTDDGGYIVGGQTLSNDGDVSGKHGLGNTQDYWIVKTDSTGNILWQKCLGSDSDDEGCSIEQTKDYGYIIGGTTHTSTNNGDVTGNHGASSDYWIVKLFPSPVGIEKIDISNIDIAIYPNPASNKINFHGSGITIEKLECLNLIGEKLLEQTGCKTFQDEVLDISSLIPGMYFLRVYTPTGEFSVKFIKE